MNIYISNLSFDVNDSDLRELFEEYGQVSSAKVITDKFSGKSRGFGFVEMPSDEEGQKAIEELNQAEYDGKVINVSVAKPREDRPERKPFGADRGGNRGGFGGNRGGFGGHRTGDRGSRPAGDRGYHNKY
jgi:RNA recognition motif-containing protein